MKISAEKYALTLSGLTDGKSKDGIKKVITDFLRVLISNNDLSKSDAIIAEMEKINDKKDGIVKASIVSANELENESIDAISEFIKSKTGAEKVKINQEKNKDLLGGVVIRYGDKIVDSSLRARVNELKKKMIK